MKTVREETPLGAWLYSECRPARLAGLVDLVWYFEGPSANRRKRVFPNGRLELLVNLGDPYRVAFGSVTTLLTQGGLSGLQSEPMVIEQPAHQKCLGIRLRPAGAYALMPAPQSELSRQVIGLQDLFGRAGLELAERCHQARSVEERFRIALDWVTERVARSRGLDRAVGWCAAQIEGSGGTASIARLREQMGFSAPRLLGAFRHQIGLTPKLYARTVRFARLLNLLQMGTPPLAEAALDAGYYDQPHMTAEFRELGGITPRDFLAARHPVGDGSTSADLSSRPAR
jgi:AraC-like DNA-binding protein